MSRTETETRPASADPPERSPFSLAWMISLGVIVAVLIGTVTTIVVLRSSGPSTSTPPVVIPSAQQTPFSQPPPVASSSVPYVPCGEVPQAEGAPITGQPLEGWEIVDTLFVPVTSSGPAKVVGNIATCYKADTLGALTAAAQIYLRANAAGGDKVREQQTTTDSLWHSDYAKRLYEQNPPKKPYLQLHAFRTGAIENNKVDIDLQLKVDDGSTGTPVIHLVMIWTGTDWMLGNSPEAPTSDDIDTMIVWEAR